MVKIPLYGLLLMLPLHIWAQGQMSIAENTFISASEQVAVHIVDTELQTNGTLEAANSSFFLSSNLNQINIGGNGLNLFGNLQLNGSEGLYKLTNSIEVESQMEINSVSLDLQAYNITFPTSQGSILGETNQSVIFSREGGRIIKFIHLNSPENVNAGNLGLSISSSENLGLTEIHRSHESTSLPSGESIFKSFEIYPEFEPQSPLDISISYFDSEAQNTDFEEQIWKLNNSGNWVNVRTSIERNSNMLKNTVSAVDTKPTLIYTVGPEKVYPIDISSIPTAFTPNGDEKNDQFIIPFIDEDFEGKVTIISRWGDILYSTEDYFNAPWDGRFKGNPLPVATYYYVVSFKNNQVKEIKGNISIVR